MKNSRPDMIGSPQNSVGYRSRTSQSNSRYQNEGPSPRNARLRSDWGSPGSPLPLTPSSSDERVKLKDEASLFVANFKIPTGEDPRNWRRFYASVEAPLRQWYQQRNSLEAKEKTLQKWDSILPFVENLMKAATKVFLGDPSYYIENELDVRVWKYGIYQFIVILRASLPSPTKYKSLIKQVYKDIFGRGIGHFTDLLIKTPATVHIELEPILQRTGFFRCSLRKEELTFEENLVYKFFIALGDLYRYAFEMFKLLTDAKMAADMYIAARFCDTEKSRAYNQLGVIRKAQNDIIGTVYNYTRASSAPNPAEGARDQLLYGYDEIYKRYNTTRNQFWGTLSKLAENNLQSESRSRMEYWVPVGAGKKVEIPPPPEVPLSKSQHLERLPVNEIFSNFSIVYTHFLGKLYTKIGTETLEEAAKDVMVYFEGLIIHKSGVKFNFLMEVLGLILYMTDYVTPPEKISSSPGTTLQLRYMQDVAVRVTLEMISVLARKTRQLIRLLDWDHPMMAACTAAMHIWCRWAKRKSFMSVHLKQWQLNQSRSPVSGKKSDKVRVKPQDNNGENNLTFNSLTSELSVLLRRHSKILFPKISSSRNGNCKTPIGMLPEQIVLDGFGDIIYPKDFDTAEIFYDGRFTLERAQTHFRLAKIARFAKRVLGESKTAYQSRFSANHNPVAPVEKRQSSESTVLAFIHESLHPKPKEFKCRRPDCNNARIILKKADKRSKETCDKGKTLQILETPVYLLWTNLSVMGVKTELVVQPVRVVLDTNCFIRRLEWIKFLMTITPHPLYVPSAVLLELRGLKKGLKYSRVREKTKSLGDAKEKMISDMVIGEQCTLALEFLNEHRHNFVMVTSAGTPITMYNYMKQKVFDEFYDPSQHNDERILETCRQLEAIDDQLRSQDSPFRIYRNTVLLTGDRSLRVRAYAADIPAREIDEMTTWLLDGHSSRMFPFWEQRTDNASSKWKEHVFKRASYVVLKPPRRA